MSAIAFNEETFRALFPAFKDKADYPSAVLSMRWDTAGIYISNQSGGCFCGGMDTAQRTYALNLMTAHLQALADAIASGNTPGILTSATIDKVTVTIEPPPAPNQWQYWLQTTPYGQQLLALLQRASVGGCYFGGRPELAAFRRQPPLGF